MAVRKTCNISWFLWAVLIWVVLSLTGCETLLKETPAESTEESTESTNTLFYRRYTETRFSMDNTLQSYFLYNYDNKGLLLSTQNYSPTSTNLNLIEYDAQNRRIRERSVSSLGNSSTRTYTYLTIGQNAGKREKRQDFDKDGNLFQYQIYLYDSSGRFSGVQIYDSSDTLQYQATVEYGTNGKQISGYRSDASNTTVELYTYDYNERGLLSRKNTKDPDGVLMSYIIYSYEQGSLIGDQMAYFY